MRVLIVEDDYASRCLLKKYLVDYGSVDVSMDGNEAVQAFVRAWKEEIPYDLVCMDIRMPGRNGHDAIKTIRNMEKDMGINGKDEVNVIMTTALSDPKNVVEAYYRGGATSYIVKPINRRKLVAEMRKLKLIEE